MQPHEPIIDPRNGQQTTIHDLARATGIRSHIIWQRWEVWGIRSLMLIAPPGTEIDKLAERRWAWRQWLRTPVGVLSTHRLGDYRRAYAAAQRQHRSAA